MTADLQPASVNPLALLQRMLDTGTNPDSLGKMMDLAERYEKTQAAGTFGRAMAEFQRRCPPIVKERKADRFAFASYDDVMRVAGPILADCGIAVSFTTPKTEGSYEIVCRLRVGAYSEDFPFSAPIPDLGKIAGFLKLSEPQAFGFVLSYYKRYSLCAAANIVITDEDNDAAGLAGDTINRAQLEELHDLLENCTRAGAPVAMPAFLKWLGVDNLQDLPQREMGRAVYELKRKIKEGPK